MGERSRSAWNPLDPNTKSRTEVLSRILANTLEQFVLFFGATIGVKLLNTYVPSFILYICFFLHICSFINLFDLCPNEINTYISYSMVFRTITIRIWVSSVVLVTIFSKLCRYYLSTIFF